MVRRVIRRRKNIKRRPLNMRRRRIPRPLKNRVNDYAGCSESIVFTAISGVSPPSSSFITGVKGTTFPVYYNTDINLGTFSRAPAIASCYQYFKIKYFELKILPDFNTWIVGGPGAQGMPVFYYMVDKAAALNNATTNQQLKSMGAKAISFTDNKAITIRWKPGVLLANQVLTSTGAISAQQKMISPWLRTDAVTATGNIFEPSQVVHYGIKYFAESVGGAQTFTATLTAHFQFKKPLLTGSTGVTTNE